MSNYLIESVTLKTELRPALSLSNKVRSIGVRAKRLGPGWRAAPRQILVAQTNASDGYEPSLAPHLCSQPM